MLPHAPWLVWAVPIAGGLLTPILARVHGKLRDWFAFLFAVVSSTFALSMLPDAFYGGSADIQMPWIPHLNLHEPPESVSASRPYWVCWPPNLDVYVGGCPEIEVSRP